MSGHARGCACRGRAGAKVSFALLVFGANLEWTVVRRRRRWVRLGKGSWLGWGSCAVPVPTPTPPRLRLTEVVGMGKLGLISPPGHAGLCTPTWQDGQWGLAVAPGLAPR